MSVLQMAEQFVPEFLKYVASRGVAVSSRRTGHLLFKDEQVAHLETDGVVPELVGGGDWAKELYHAFVKVQALAPKDT